MDRLTTFSTVTIVVFSFLFISCSTEDVTLIYLDEALKNGSSTPQLSVDLEHFMYLDSGVILLIKNQYPEFIAKRQKTLTNYVIDNHDKIGVTLRKKYDSIELLVEHLDPEVVNVLKNKFGISDPKKDKRNRILVYKNSAYVEFIGTGSVHAVTLELKEKNQLAIGLAFIIME